MISVGCHRAWCASAPAILYVSAQYSESRHSLCAPRGAEGKMPFGQPPALRLVPGCCLLWCLVCWLVLSQGGTDGCKSTPFHRMYRNSALFGVAPCGCPAGRGGDLSGPRRPAD